MLRVVFCAILLLMLGCRSRNQNVTIQTHHQLTIVDSTAQTRYSSPYTRDNRMGDYPVYYLGPQQDTLFLGAAKIPGYAQGAKDYDQELQRFTRIDSTTMKIVVDTAFHLAYAAPHYTVEKSGNKQVLDYVSYYKAYPIFVYNLTDSLLWVGKFSEVGCTVRQAKNRQGKWLDIEKPIEYFCSTGARQLVLEPHQQLVAKLRRYKGTYKTACRLKYTRNHRTVYSNTFIDYLDPRQIVPAKDSLSL